MPQDTRNPIPLHRSGPGIPSQDDGTGALPPGHVLIADSIELRTIAREVGAETYVVGLNTEMSFHVKGPATVIIAYPVEDGEPGL